MVPLISLVLLKSTAIMKPVIEFEPIGEDDEIVVSTLLYKQCGVEYNAALMV
jgi:hypothetical protein